MACRVGQGGGQQDTRGWDQDVPRGPRVHTGPCTSMLPLPSLGAVQVPPACRPFSLGPSDRAAVQSASLGHPRPDPRNFFYCVACPGPSWPSWEDTQPEAQRPRAPPTSGNLVPILEGHSPAPHTHKRPRHMACGGRNTWA